MAPPYPEVTLVALGALSILPPYIGPSLGLELDVADDVEIVDHVITGSVVVACGALAAGLAVRRAATQRLGATGLTLALALPGLCFLAGLWQVATHVPLVAAGGDPGVPWGAVLLHSAAGPFILALALWLTLRDPDPRERHDR